MNKKKLLYLFTFLFVCFLCVKPVMKTEAATVKVVLNGKTKKYSKKKNYSYVNGKKISISKQPTFMRETCYMGPVGALLSSSSLKVTVKASSASALTLSYNDNVLKMTNGSRQAYINGQAFLLDTAPLYIKYKSSGYKRWVVPLQNVCQKLGINYVVKSQVVYMSAPTNKEYKNQILICIDAGHGGSDPGAYSTDRLTAEKNLTLAILKSAKQYFDCDPRFAVCYTRTSDTYPSLAARYNLANNAGAALFISVHINSCDSKTVNGTETLYSKSRVAATTKNGVNSAMLANAMQKAAVAATGFPNRGIVDRPNLQLLKYSKMPSCIIEYGFISNVAARNAMVSNTAKYGTALYKSIVDFSVSNHLVQ